MQHTKALLQDIEQGMACSIFLIFISVVIPEHGFGELEIPVAVLVPEKVINGLGNQIEAVNCDGVFDILQCVLQARQDPGINL